MTKVCSRCNLAKPANAKHFNRRGVGLKQPCKACRRIDPVAKAWRQRPEKGEYNKKWRKTPAGREYQRRCNGRRDHSKLAMKTRLALNLRVRLNAAIRAGTKAGSAVADLGCSINGLRAHLEARFAQGMSWENWGRKGWHIDHVRPLAAFDLTDRREFLEACHYTNLQPLWWQDNLAKGAR